MATAEDRAAAAAEAAAQREANKAAKARADAERDAARAVEKAARETANAEKARAATLRTEQATSERAQRMANQGRRNSDDNDKRDMERFERLLKIAPAVPGTIRDLLDRGAEAAGAFTGLGGSRERADSDRMTDGYNAQTGEEIARRTFKGVKGSQQVQTGKNEMERPSESGAPAPAGRSASGVTDVPVLASGTVAGVDPRPDPKRFVFEAAHALANGAQEIDLSKLKKDKGIYTLPAHNYPTGRADANGKPIMYKVEEPGLELSEQEMQRVIKLQLNKALGGVAAPAPATMRQLVVDTKTLAREPKIINTGAPAAPPAGTTPATNPPAAPAAQLPSITPGTGPSATSYSGIKPADMPAGLKQDRVAEVQAALKNAGYNIGSTKLHPNGLDDKWGEKSQGALMKAAQAAGIKDYKEIDFSNPNDPEFKQLLTHLQTKAVPVAALFSSPSFGRAAAPIPGLGAAALDAARDAGAGHKLPVAEASEACAGTRGVRPASTSLQTDI